MVSNFIRQALTGEPLTIYGRGSQTRSFCYVDDLIRGVLAMGEPNGPMGPINLGNPTETSIAELAADLTGTSKCLVVHHDLPADDPVRRRSDISQAERLLGWRPCIDLKEGMTRTIVWFRHCALDRTRLVRN